VKHAILHPQRFLNGEVHDWYRIILGYSDHFVGGILDEFKLKGDAKVIDPFCGSGTTLVEAMKRGFSVTGIDANPSSCFAARVKTTWDIDPDVVRRSLPKLKAHYSRAIKVDRLELDPFFRYLEEFNYLKRWISRKPAKKIVALKRAIKALRIAQKYKDLLLLALLAETVSGSSNIKFGPELYCSKKRRLDSPVFSNFESRVRKMCNDLSLVIGTKFGNASVIRGDARSCGQYFGKKGQFSALISSPPYPTEHDYTRNSRLELALLGFVTDRATLRKIKFDMIRSHTKGIYKSDKDSMRVLENAEIQSLVRAIDKKAAFKTHGFARLYSKVLREYFGGLRRHFQSVKPLLIPGAMCAYVVGDQSSYLRIPIPTAKILRDIAVEAGFEHVETRRWRRRWSTSSNKFVAENVLILRVPATGRSKEGKR
jgi:hypothetical protein